MMSAVCRQVDPELFFPSSSNTAPTTIRRAKVICQQCPVQLQCLDAALENDERHGIWGGINFGTARSRAREELRVQRRVTPRDEDEHGGTTDAGARRHYRKGERPCFACAEAALQYGRTRRA
jgi:WhiB family transcriptional regulator, redox-sensing transcriptional regulator